MLLDGKMVLITGAAWDIAHPTGSVCQHLEIRTAVLPPRANHDIYWSQVFGLAVNSKSAQGENSD